MQEDLESTSLDFLTLVAWWNLYALPLVLVAVVVAAIVAARRHRRGSTAADGTLAVLRLSLIHYALAVRAAILLAQELLSLRVMGIPESLIILIGSAIAVVINPLLGFGLGRRLRGRRTRWSALVWYTLLVLIAGYTAYWMWEYRAVADPARWPEHAVSLVLPFFLWGAMFLPRVRRVFTSGVEAESDRPMDAAEMGNPSPSPAPEGWPWASLLALVFLIIVCSTVIVEAMDWIHRLASEPELTP